MLSDMEFDSSTTAHRYETDHQQAERKFTQAGYTLPEIIYWNLAARSNPASVPGTLPTSPSLPSSLLLSRLPSLVSPPSSPLGLAWLKRLPVTKNTPGVSLISGFSGNLLQLFMEDPTSSKIKMDPILIMERVCLTSIHYLPYPFAAAPSLLSLVSYLPFMSIQDTLTHSFYLLFSRFSAGHFK